MAVSPKRLLHPSGSPTKAVTPTRWLPYYSNKMVASPKLLVHKAVLLLRGLQAVISLKGLHAVPPPSGGSNKSIAPPKQLLHPSGHSTEQMLSSMLLLHYDRSLFLSALSVAISLTVAVRFTLFVVGTVLTCTLRPTLACCWPWSYGICVASCPYVGARDAMGNRRYVGI